MFDKIRNTVPNVTISTDIIVGFPGEDEDDFMDTMDLVEKCKFDNAFSFVFSKREGTPACKLSDDTPEEEKNQRLYRLNERLNKCFLESNKNEVGKVVKVLVDGKNSTNKTQLFGYTENNKLINFNGSEELIGEIVSVKVVEAKTWSLDGELVE